MSDLINPYQPPLAALEDAGQYAGENTSGRGKDAIIPDEIKGWSWGGFLWSWIWGIGNNTYIALLALIPYVGFIVSIYLGVKGRELAWRNKRWDSIEHFQSVQRKWALWWLWLVGGMALLGILAAIILPMVANH